MNVLDFLPQNKFQLIGFIVYVVCHSLVQIVLGKWANNRSSSNQKEGDKND